MEDNVIRAAFGSSTHSKTREMQIARLREIENAGSLFGLGKKGHVLRLSDRIIAARVTGGQVRAAREQGVSVGELRDVLESHGTSRIDRYTLSPRPADATQASAMKLQGKVSGYLAVASAVAALTGRDPDALKIDVLVGTSLWSRASSLQANEDPRASHLALELIEMGKSVARTKKVDELFRAARRLAGRWHATTQLITASAQPILAGDSYLECFEHWTEAPPLLSVPLVRCVHSLLHLPRVRIEREGHSQPYKTAQLTDDFDGNVETGFLELSREIRLAIGPSTAPPEIDIMFESRAHVRLFINGREATPLDLQPACTLKPIDDLAGDCPSAVFQAQIGDRWHRVATLDPIDGAEAQVFARDACPLHWSVNPLNPAAPIVEHWYFSWAAVNEATVTHWLDRPSGTNNAVAISNDGGGRAQPVWYAQGSIAYEIERDLASGGLEQTLSDAVDTLRRAIAAQEGQWRHDAQTTHEKRMARWGMGENE